MNASFLSLWEEPLYRLILQITVAEVVLLGVIMVGIVVTREIRVVQNRRNQRISKALFDPFMGYLAGDLTLEEIHEIVRRIPKRTVCLALERYALMLEGETLSKMRALYERLKFRHLGLKLAGSLFWWRRLEGMRLLGATGGDEIVDVLMGAIQDSHPVVRLAAVRSLGRIRNTRAIRAGGM